MKRVPMHDDGTHPSLEIANGTSATIQTPVKIVALGKSMVSDSASVTSTTFDSKSTNNSGAMTTGVYGR